MSAITLEQAYAAIRAAKEAEESQRIEANRAFVGRAFRYRNCYSVPQAESDYWWMYGLVTEPDSYTCRGLTVQRDSQGEISIKPNGWINPTDGGWTEIPVEEFWAAASDITKSIADAYSATRAAVA